MMAGREVFDLTHAIKADIYGFEHGRTGAGGGVTEA